MRKFLLFLAGLTAAILFLVHLGPMILLGVSIWLVYLVFKQFIKAETTLAKVGWVVLGLFILSIGISNIYAVIGIAAVALLYYIIKHWDQESDTPDFLSGDTDAFMNFDQQWNDI
ncbi:MAG TPA: flagellar basal body rod protein [Pseudogracilibacillus sp.]|nr:flagellar basal body rod protein [Pseudogracilibacillus sp.]